MSASRPQHTELEQQQILGVILPGETCPILAGLAVVGFLAKTWEGRFLVFDAHGEQLGDFANQANANSFISRRWSREFERVLQ